MQEWTAMQGSKSSLVPFLVWVTLIASAAAQEAAPVNDGSPAAKPGVEAPATDGYPACGGG